MERATHLTKYDKLREMVINNMLSNAHKLDLRRDIKTKDIDNENKRIYEYGENKMDMKKFKGNNYLTVEEVNKANEKKIVILNKGEEYKTQYGEAVRFEVQLAGNEEVFLFTPFSKSINTMIEQEGEESIKWVGKVFNVGIETTRTGNDVVVVVQKTE